MLNSNDTIYIFDFMKVVLISHYRERNITNSESNDCNSVLVQSKSENNLTALNIV